MGINTEQFAARNLVKPESVVSRLCRTGSYFGVRPVKLGNGRLLWPDVPVPAAAAPATTAREVEQSAAAI
jgi:hypothetical protein